MTADGVLNALKYGLHGKFSTDRINKAVSELKINRDWLKEKKVCT